MVRVENILGQLNAINNKINNGDAEEINNQIDLLERIISRFFENSSYYHQLTNGKKEIIWARKPAGSNMGHTIERAIKITTSLLNNMIEEVKNFGIPYKNDLVEEKLEKSTMKYNVYIQCDNGSFNIFNLDENSILNVVNAYKKGSKGVTVNFVKYHFKTISEIAIVTNDKGLTTEELEKYAEQFDSSFSFGKYPLDTGLLSQFGKNVTSDFLEDKNFGYEQTETKPNKKTDLYVNSKRLQELQQLKHSNFDLSKLIRICEELNSNWINENFFTVGLLLRTIINHVPPIFDATFTSFDKVIGGYGSQSFKKNMKHLNESLRSSADGYTHFLIRKKEPLPNEQQVDYKNNLDVLLAEIITVLH
ncbi:MAG TPA: hypothetical protein VIM16_17960 [Mucilaginibacter sp.]|jgi:hypothetical protein